MSGVSKALAGAHQTYVGALAQLEQAMVSVEGAVAAGDPTRLRETVPLLAEVKQLLAAAQGLVKVHQPRAAGARNTRVMGKTSVAPGS